MGFFKNLFEKKVCDICGEEIGLLGNRKLEDGNCCKDCAKKLSPWFTDRKTSTVAEIKDQLESREANRQAVAAFHTTRSFGRDMKVLVDGDARKFMVTRARDPEEANPDVLEFSQVTACDTDIRESKSEVYRQVRTSEGETKRESYSPRRYRYSYDFYVTISVNHPYIDEIPFSLSGGYFEVEARSRVTASEVLFGGRDGRDSSREGSVNPPDTEDRRRNSDYVRYEAWAKELRELLLSREPEKPAGIDFAPLIAAYVQAEERYAAAKQSGDSLQAGLVQREKMAAMKALYDAAQKDLPGSIAADVQGVLDRYRDPAPTAPSQPEPPKTVTCPWCGSQTPAAKFCEHCGGNLTE